MAKRVATAHRQAPSLRASRRPTRRGGVLRTTCLATASCWPALPLPAATGATRRIDAGILAIIPRFLLVAPIFLLAALGCGARTDLDRPSPEDRDAGSDAGSDAGFFVTFPCRWYLGDPVTVATGTGFSALTGAMHSTGDLAAVAATGVDTGERVGALISTLGRPEIRASLGGPAIEGELFTGVDGFLRQDADGCAVVGYDFEWSETERFAWDDPSVRCQLTQSEPGALASASIGAFARGDLFEVSPLFGEPPAATRIGLTRATADGAAIFRHPELDETIAVVLITGTLGIERTIERTTERRRRLADGGTGVRFSAAPDRLRGGVVILYRGATVGWRLERIGWDGSADARSVVDLTLLPAPPIGRLASNETEALIPLEDGTLAYIPLAMSEIRIIGPVADGPVDAMEIVMRPGQSAGGLLFVPRGSGPRPLMFRPLVCNR